MKAKDRSDGREALLLYMHPELKIALKKAAIDRRCHVYQIVEDLVRAWVDAEGEDER